MLPETGEGASQSRVPEASVFPVQCSAGLAGRHPGVVRFRLAGNGDALDLGQVLVGVEPAGDPPAVRIGLALVEIHGDLAVGNGVAGKIEDDDAVAQRLGRGGPGVGLQAHGTLRGGKRDVGCRRLDLAVGVTVLELGVERLRRVDLGELDEFRACRPRIVESQLLRGEPAGLPAARHRFLVDAEFILRRELPGAFLQALARKGVLVIAPEGDRSRTDLAAQLHREPPRASAREVGYGEIDADLAGLHGRLGGPLDERRHQRDAELLHLEGAGAQRCRSFLSPLRARLTS